MKKTEIISLVHKCACAYEENLSNTQIMFVYLDSQNQVSFTEVRFRSHNFLHFTGLIPRYGISANKFYHLILNHNLSPNDFAIEKPLNTERKLQILSKITVIDQIARMIGDYIGPCIALYTEKIIAIYKMKSSERTYSRLIYRKKDIILEKSLFPATILSKINPQLWEHPMK